MFKIAIFAILAHSCCLPKCTWCEIISFMNDKNRQIFNILQEMHGDAQCELNFSTPFELLVAVVLSAQCTDVRVNKVTAELFKVASTPEQFVSMPLEELEKWIYSCGFYHNKALSIKSLSQDIIEMGGMPTTQEGLVKLRGVGRKTANVVYSVAYGGNAIAVDTHVFRVSNRIGLVSAKTPEQTEEQLMQAFDEDLWGRLHHLLIFQGRYVCHSQKPNCEICALKEVCNHYQKNTNN